MREIVLLAATALMLGCSVDGTVESKSTFVYHPADKMIPYPSDRYLERTDRDGDDLENETGFRISTAGFAETDPALAKFIGVSEGLSDLDGFGTSSEIVVSTSVSAELGALETAEAAIGYSVADTSPVWLIAIGEENPGERVPFVARREPDGRAIFMRPWKPLAPSGWYALVFRKGLTDVFGGGFKAPPEFLEDYRSGSGEGLEGEGYARLRAVLDEQPVFALTFRTASVFTRFERILNAVRDGAPPPFTYTTRLPDPGDYPDLSLIVDGEFKHRNFRDEHGKLHDQPIGEEWLKFTVTIPKVTPEFGEPFPVVLGQHGLGDKRQRVLALAGGLAREGLASIAIDAPSHGSRGPGDGLATDSLESARSVLGIWTEEGKLRFEPWYFRDIIRQQVLDHLQVLQVLSAFDLDFPRADNQAGQRDLAPKPAGYSGQSMGGIMGGVSGAMLTEFPRVVLNVPGGRLSNLLVQNQMLGDFLIAALRPKETTMADVFRMIAMAQTSLDPGDPINYVHRIAARPIGEPRPLLIQAAYQDATLPNPTTFDLARVADTPLAGPWMQSVPGLSTLTVPSEGLSGDDARAFYFFHEVESDGETVVADHGNVWSSDTALSQAATFLATGVIEPR